MAKIKTALLMAIFFLIVIIMSGTFVYQKLEGWSFVDSLYFTTMTLTTVGYGDFAPTTDTSKIFTVFFSISGIAVALYVMFTIGRHFMGDVYLLRERINALTRRMPKRDFKEHVYLLRKRINDVVRQYQEKRKRR